MHSTAKEPGRNDRQNLQQDPYCRWWLQCRHILNELTAKATGKEVHAGPTEATAIGNITAQMLKAEEFKSIEEARTTIHESFGIKVYQA